MEGHFNLGEDGDWGSVFCSWNESPLRDGFDGVFIEAHAEGMKDGNLGGGSGGVDDDAYGDPALELAFSGRLQRIAELHLSFVRCLSAVIGETSTDHDIEHHECWKTAI